MSLCLQIKTISAVRKEAEMEKRNRMRLCFGDHKGLPNSSDVGVRIKIIPPGTSLVVQWLRVHLPMQDTRVQCLVGKIPHIVGHLSPCNHNY